MGYHTRRKHPHDAHRTPLVGTETVPKYRLGIGWNKARIKFLARFLVALIAVKTVCLTQIASVFAGKAKPASHYKRIQRFLRGFDLDFAALARLVVSLVDVPAPWVLSLDRTNWKVGKAQINFLVLALVHKGMAFPWDGPLEWSVGMVRAGKRRAGQGGQQQHGAKDRFDEAVHHRLGQRKDRLCHRRP